MAADDAPPPAKAPQSAVFRAIVNRPVAVTMTVVAVCVFGIVSLQKLPVTLLPEMSFPTLTIRTEYPGAAPGEVEELVTKPMEDNVAVVSNLTGYRSVSRAGGCDVILEFAWKTPMTFAVQEVREKLDQLQTRLPRGVERPLVLRYDPTFDPILRIGLSGEADLYQLRAYAEDELKRRLETIPGVAAVRVKGGFEKEIRVELSEEMLRHHKVSLATINERLAAENVNVASGILRDGDVEYMVRTLNEFRTPEEIGALVVAMEGGQPVRL
jgi:hydrophobic/amphiphilic exporter-1 (mainly G- bacteria), HAE1 family